jgi:hypothetical protein
MNRTRPLTALALVAGLALSAAACGGDDDAADTTTAPAATVAATDAPATDAPATDASTTEPAGTMPTGEGDAAAFCAAEMQIEAAASTDGDPMPAVEAALAAAPADVKPALEGVVAAFSTGDTESPAFTEPYGEMMSWMKDNCGYSNLDVTTTEYAFAGIPDEVPAGPTIITMTNLGEEFHEVLLMRKNDGVTESFEEILALGEEESQSMVTFAGAAFGPPGAESHGVANLNPGEYLAICFLPEGATPELMAQMEGPESSLPEGAGPPHFTHGMLFEFTVTG